MIKKLSIIAVCIMFSATLLSANTGRANEMIIAHHHKQNIDRIDKKDFKCSKDCKQQQDCKKADKCTCDDNCKKTHKNDKCRSK